MYIQITSRCNMSCAHCGMNCTAQGENMSFKTFKRAIEMSSECIVIGGGEPTVHPQFEKFLLYAIARCESVFMVTNGKLTDKALALARLNKLNGDSERFVAELSQDEYHDPIDPLVIQAFDGHIRDTSHHLINSGRCDFGLSDECICEGDPFVKPNGDVHQCGCDDSPKVGNVFDGFESLDADSGDWICHKKI